MENRVFQGKFRVNKEAKVKQTEGAAVD